MSQPGHTSDGPHPTTDALDAVYQDDDGLGYYPDGVKRTLTDEQIEIFRHSELEGIRREQEKKDKRKVEDDEEEQVADIPADRMPAGSQSSKKAKRSNKPGPRREPKPDLRKRTWDVVETGLDSLDYD
jgi:hypothetical protein